MIVYVITDGKGYYATQNVAGRYFPVCSFEGCVQFDSYAKAKNTLKSCLGKSFNRKFHVEEVVIDDPPVLVHPAQENDAEVLDIIQVVDEKSTKDASRIDAIKDLVDEPLVENFVPKVHESLKAALDILEEAYREKEFLNNRLRVIDCEISDVEHYTEFSEGLNVYQGWLAYKLLKRRLEERRIIKDELMMLNNADETIESLKKAVHQIDGMTNRQYSPRVLKELFA